jgi:hypothetical protein
VAPALVQLAAVEAVKLAAAVALPDVLFLDVLAGVAGEDRRRGGAGRTRRGAGLAFLDVLFLNVLGAVALGVEAVDALAVEAPPGSRSPRSSSSRLSRRSRPKASRRWRWPCSRPRGSPSSTCSTGPARGSASRRCRPLRRSRCAFLDVIGGAGEGIGVEAVQAPRERERAREHLDRDHDGVDGLVLAAGDHGRADEIGILADDGVGVAAIATTGAARALPPALRRGAWRRGRAARCSLAHGQPLIAPYWLTAMRCGSSALKTASWTYQPSSAGLRSQPT